jgi:hypothetical protein
MEALVEKPHEHAKGVKGMWKKQDDAGGAPPEFALERDAGFGVRAEGEVQTRSAEGVYRRPQSAIVASLYGNVHKSGKPVQAERDLVH